MWAKGNIICSWWNCSTCSVNSCTPGKLWQTSSLAVEMQKENRNKRRHIGGKRGPDFVSELTVDNSWNTEYYLVYSSKISNLFARDEMDEITQSLISVMKKELPRHPPTFDNLYEYFISRSRKNLHVVLCFSPVSFYFSYLYVGGVTYLNIFRWFTFSDEMIYLETSTCYIEIKSILYYYQSPWIKSHIKV